MKITHKLLGLLLLFIVAPYGNSMKAQSPSLVWTKAINSISGSSSRGYDMTTDSNGNVIVVGTYNGTADFCPGPCTYTLSTGAFQNIFIAKYDSLGNFIWVKGIGSAPLGEQANSVTVDNQNNILIAGYFADNTDFDPGPAVATLSANPGSGGDAFILKLDNDGNYMWAKGFGGMFNDEIKTIRCDINGNILVGGNFIDTADFDPGAASFTLNANSNNDSFIAKYDSNGNFIWAKQFAGNNTLASLNLDNNGNILVTGNIFFTSDFDPGLPLYNLGPPTTNNIGLYVTKLDSNGNFLWANGTFAPNENITGRSLTSDNLDNIYITGYFMGIPDFDPSVATYTLPSASLQRTYILKYNNSGNFQWVKTINGPTGHNWGNAVGIDAQNNPVIAGYYNNETDFDPGPGTYTLPAVSSTNMPSYVLNLSPTGNFNYAYQISGNSWPNAVKCSTANIVYTTGYYTATGDFDPGPSTNTMALTGALDGFMHKMGPICTMPAPPTDITPANQLTICSGNATTLTATSAGLIKWYNAPSAYNVMAYGTAYNTPTLSAGSFTYYAESNTCQTNPNRTPVHVTVAACTGNEEFNYTESCIIYPNPFHKELFIETNGINNPIASVETYSSDGKMISRTENKHFITKMHLLTEEKGLLLIKIFFADGTSVSQKVMSY